MSLTTMAVAFIRIFLVLIFAELTMLIESVTITTINGKIQGYSEVIDGVTVDIYLGVPFAAPPVGNLRFKAPQPVQNWTNVLDATEQPNSCMQSLDTNFDRFSGVDMWNTKTEISEDCLYLNLWVPRIANDSGLPVMLWFYGGSYVYGSITLDVYDGRYLALKNHVIVASMQYRMGVHGFLHTGTEDAPGNMGLLDQQLAMKWVYDNIDRFGGDKNRICLFGESAGASSISHHLLAPSSWPYFNNAILLSSSSLSPWAIDTSLNLKIHALNFAKIMKCPQGWTELVECLRNKSASELELKQWELDNKNIGTFSPVIDGSFLRDDPHVLLNSGKIKDANIMAGTTTDEGEFFLVYFYQDYFLPDRLWDPAPLNRSSFLELVSRITETRDKLKTDAVLYTYENSKLVSDRGNYTDILDDLLGDTYFKCPVRDFCGGHSQLSPSKGQSYLYTFDFRSSVNPWPSWMGSLHGYEIESAFGLPFNPALNYSDADRNMSQHVMKYMTNFAKTSDPNNDGHNTGDNMIPVWQPFDLTSEYYISFTQNNGPVEKQDYRRRECTFWSGFMPKLNSYIQHGCISNAERAYSPKPLTLLLSFFSFLSYLL